MRLPGHNHDGEPSRYHYVRHDCRGDECRELNTEYHRNYMASRNNGFSTPRVARHGTESMYRSGCREPLLCPAEPTCTEVHRVYNQSRRTVRSDVQ